MRIVTRAKFISCRLPRIGEPDCFYTTPFGATAANSEAGSVAQRRVAVFRALLPWWTCTSLTNPAVGCAKRAVTEKVHAFDPHPPLLFRRKRRGGTR